MAIGRGRHRPLCVLACNGAGQGRTRFAVDLGGRLRAGGHWARDGGCAERGGDPVVDISMVICEVVAS
jgi:hypothetical protein